MRLQYFLKSISIFFAFFFLVRLIFQNDHQQSSLQCLVERKPINLSSIYRPDVLVINKNICPKYGRDLKLFIVVLSAPDGVKRREAVRRTWGHFSMRRDVEIAFFIGESNIAHWIKELEKEEKIYQDIIRCPLLDEPEVPTFKLMQALEWANNFCYKAKFLLKTNDDVFINLSKLLLLITKLNLRDKNIYGRLARMWEPTRSIINHNSISLDEYPSPFFPDFTIGPTYLFPIHLCKELFQGCLRQNFIKSDDVFLTGLVAESLGIKRVHMESFVNARLSATTCNVRRALSLKCLEPIDLFDFWIVVHDLNIKCEKLPNSTEVRQKESHDYVLSRTSLGEDPEGTYVMAE